MVLAIVSMTLAERTRAVEIAQSLIEWFNLGFSMNDAVELEQLNHPDEPSTVWALARQRADAAIARRK